MRRESNPQAVIARSEATKQSRVACVALDCFAEPVIGRRFAPTRWLAMTENYIFNSRPVTRRYASR
jgi:hypothetical protein